MSAYASELAWIGEFLSWFFLAQIGILWIILPLVVISIRRRMEQTSERQQRIIDELLLLRGMFQRYGDGTFHAQTVTANQANLRVMPPSLGSDNMNSEHKTQSKPSSPKSAMSNEDGTSLKAVNTAVERPSSVKSGKGNKAKVSKSRGSGQPFLDQMLGSTEQQVENGSGNHAAPDELSAVDEIPIQSSNNLADCAPEDSFDHAEFESQQEHTASTIRLNAYDANDFDDEGYDDGYDEDEEFDGGESVADLVSLSAVHGTASGHQPAEITETDDGLYLYRGKRYNRRADAERQQRIDLRP